MKRISKNGASRGIATLEFALLSVLFSSLLCFGFALSSFMQRSYRIGVSLDRNLRADIVRAVRLEPNELGVTSSVSSAELQRMIIELNLTLQHENNFSRDRQRLLIETAYAVMEFDQTSGELIALSDQGSLSAGDLALPSSLARQTDLTHMFAQRRAEVLEGGARRSPYDSPFSDPSAPEGIRYLRFGVLVGARIIYSLQDQFSGRIFQALGGEPFAYGARTSAVRGELK